MNLKARGIGVDAGTIMVADMDYLEDVPSPDVSQVKALGRIFDIPIGKYSVEWNIPDTWNGSIQGVETLEVTSGKIFVCDPCYCIGRGDHADWMQYLKDTDYCRKIASESAFVIDEMGGDGEYNVNLELERV